MASSSTSFFPAKLQYDRTLPFISELSAIVTVSDDGGSSGRLRKELNVPPPGDIRNCIVALSEKEALLSRLFQYRFKAGEGLEGHSFGNLFLSAMTDITGDFSEAVKHAAAILATRGHIYPATTSNAQLYAVMDDGYGSARRDQYHRQPTPDRRTADGADERKASTGRAGSHRERRLDYDRSGVAVHQPRTEPAGARFVEGDQEFAGDQGLRLQSDDAGK